MLRVCIDDAGNVVEAGGRRLFDADEVPPNMENFVARSRQYLPLLMKKRVGFYFNFRACTSLLPHAVVSKMVLLVAISAYLSH